MGSKMKASRREAIWFYIFVSPWVLGFLFFSLGPMIASFFYSFTDWNMFETPRFIGFSNYIKLLTGCTLSEYLSQSRFKMRLERNEWDKTGKAEIARDRANLTETILRVCDSNNEKNGQNFISVFEVMKNKRIIG